MKDQDSEAVGSGFVKRVTHRVEEGTTGLGPLLGRIPKGDRGLAGF